MANLHPRRWIYPTPQGLYCAPGDFHIDPAQPVERALITHGHGDHARRGHGRVLATRETGEIMKVRLGTDGAGEITAAALGETIRISDVSVRFLPAGHILGSAQIVIEHAGSRVVVSGDYKRTADPTCSAQDCDILLGVERDRSQSEYQEDETTIGPVQVRFRVVESRSGPRKTVLLEWDWNEGSVEELDPVRQTQKLTRARATGTTKTMTRTDDGWRSGSVRHARGSRRRGVTGTRRRDRREMPEPEPPRPATIVGINRSSFAHNCFSCGYKGTLQSLLVELTGAAPPDLEDELRKQSFLRRIAVREQPEEILESVISEWSLRNLLKDVPQRLLELRWLVRSAIDKYQVRWNPGTRQWVLPLWDVGGTLLGAQFRQTGNVLTLPPGLPKSTLFFGYHEVKDYDWAVVVESPLDAVRLFGLGIPAFATLGAFVSREQVTLMSRTFSYVILALDNDKAGHEGAEVVRPMLRRAGCATIEWDYDRPRGFQRQASEGRGRRAV